MQGLPAGGAMAAVAADEARVAELVAPFSRSVSVARLKGPDNTGISGERTAVELIIQAREAQGIHASFLAVSHAFHSPLMDPVLDEFERGASEIQYAAPRIGLISSLTGELFSGDV